MDDLTKVQKSLLAKMYKEYISNSKYLNHNVANYFDDSNNIKIKYLDDLDNEYVSEICWSLKSKGYITCTPGDNLANNIRLTDKTIIYFENRFKNNIIKLGKFINSLR